MLLATVTTPASEPVSLAEAKAHLRILHGTEDDLVSRLIRAARAHVETTTGRALVARTLDLFLGGFPHRAIELPRPPLVSVASVKYLDAAGVEQTVAPAEYHVLAEDQFAGRLELAFGKSWPATAAHPKAVTVRFTAGYGAADAVPEPIRNALLLAVEHFYHHRAASAESAPALVPMAVDSLLSPYRTFGWI